MNNYVKKRKGIATKFSDIPNEIIVEIFLYVPYKKLVKCKTVSKYFNEVITSRLFISNLFLNIYNLTGESFWDKLLGDFHKSPPFCPPCTLKKIGKNIKPKFKCQSQLHGSVPIICKCTKRGVCFCCDSNICFDCYSKSRRCDECNCLICYDCLNDDESSTFCLGVDCTNVVCFNCPQTISTFVCKDCNKNGYI